MGRSGLGNEQSQTISGLVKLSDIDSLKVSIKESIIQDINQIEEIRTNKTGNKSMKSVGNKSIQQSSKLSYKQSVKNNQDMKELVRSYLEQTLYKKH